jgi:uncharacterized protein YneF (UPF0154 family)
MTEAKILKMWYRGYLERQYVPTKFHENPPIGSKVINGGLTDRQTRKHTDMLVIDKATFISRKQAKNTLFLKTAFVHSAY